MNATLRLRPYNASLFGCKFNMRQTIGLSFAAAIFAAVFDTKLAMVGPFMVAVMLYHGIKIRTVFALCVYASFLDVLTTWFALSHGLASEANVAALYLMGMLGPVKTMAIIKSLILFAVYRAYRLRPVYDVGFCVLLYAVFFSCVAANNISFILGIVI